MRRSFRSRLKSRLADALGLFLVALIIAALFACAMAIYALKVFIAAHAARAGWGW